MRMITTKELIEANRKALADGTLIAKNMADGGKCAFIDGDPCIYRYAGKFVCAIGAVLNDDEIADIVEHGYNEDHNVLDLVSVGVVQFEDIGFALALQCEHDNWAIYHRHDSANYRALLDAGKVVPSDTEVRTLDDDEF